MLFRSERHFRVELQEKDEENKAAAPAPVDQVSDEDLYASIFGNEDTEQPEESKPFGDEGITEDEATQMAK